MVQQWCTVQAIGQNYSQQWEDRVAKVVDKCDSLNGCDKAHDFQPSCKNNIVDASKIVWDDLGLNIDDGEVPVTWTMAW